MAGSPLSDDIVAAARLWVAHAEYDGSAFYAMPERMDSWAVQFVSNVWRDVVPRETLEKDPFLFSCSVRDLWVRNALNGVFRHSSVPVLGGIVCWGINEWGHCGIVEQIRDDGFAVNMIEGVRNRMLGYDTVSRRLIRLNFSHETALKKWRYLGCIYPPGATNDHE